MVSRVQRPLQVAWPGPLALLAEQAVLQLALQRALQRASPQALVQAWEVLSLQVQQHDTSNELVNESGAGAKADTYSIVTAVARVGTPASSLDFGIKVSLRDGGGGRYSTSHQHGRP